MRNLISLFIFIVFFASCNSNNNGATLVSSEEMKELMAIDSVQLIDVRSLEAFQKGHLKGAQNLVYDDDFVQKIKQLDKTKPVAVYCRTGKRSEKCSKILKEEGFKKIYQLQGGITQWEHEIEIEKDTIVE